ncbi:MAG: hypothetical protein ACRBCJ_12965 [Hyphomicrobiaceae bacterium]
MLEFAENLFITVYDFLAVVTDVSYWTYFIICGLALWAGYLLREGLSSNWIAIFFFPGFVLGGLIGRHIFIEYGIFVSPNQDANLILATGAGLIAALLFLVIALRLYLYATTIRGDTDPFR